MAGVSVPPLVPARLLYPVPEAAVLLGVSRSKAWSLVYAGRLATKRLDGRRLVPREVIEAYVEDLPEDEDDAA